VAKDRSIDWSKKCWKEMLIYQRKLLWLDDTLDKLANWLDLKPGMTAIDVGCGLGYLGYTYWPYFGKNGRYVGIDRNRELAAEARHMAHEWAIGGKAEFVNGDAYYLPMPDNCADWVMCQVVLIHLKNPERALEEMVRITRPGGLIMCKEPDNESNAILQTYNSLPEWDIETELLAKKVNLICTQGRIRLGQGDAGFGRKVPHAMKKLGLIDIGIRQNDKVHYLEPPYDTPLKKNAIENLKKELLNEERREVVSAWQREQFIAGGGNPDEFDQLKKIGDQRIAALRTQIDRGEYIACGGGLFYIIKGRKPN